MAVLEKPVEAPFRYGRHLYVRAPKPIHFPSEESLEDAVSESKRHLEARTILYALLKAALLKGVIPGSSIGSEQFLYGDPEDPKKGLSPDAFIKLGSTDQDFSSWKIWERGAPDLAVEIVSESDHRDTEWNEKLNRYRATGIREVVRFDERDEVQPIRVWDWMEGDLVERSASDPRARECVALGLWWVVRPGLLGPTLRLSHDMDGNALLPTPDESLLVAERVAGEERRARALAEHKQMLAEHKQMLAEQAIVEERRARALAEKERDAALAEVERLRRELRLESTKTNG